MTFPDAIGRFLIRMRWALISLYVLVVLVLFGIALSNGEFGVIAAILIGLVSQVLFCVARGNPRLLRPVTFHRSWSLAGIAAGMAAVLTFGMIAAMAELFKFEGDGDTMLLVVFFSSWLLWGILFSILIIGRDRLKAFRRLVLWLIAGSLLQLTATISAHMIVLRRGGCLIGIGTGMGITCGACVLLWAFGPAILLLCFYEAQKRLKGNCPGCGYDVRGLTELRCPECGRRFTPHEVGLTMDELRARPADALTD